MASPRGLIASTAWLKGRPKPRHPSDVGDWDWIVFAPHGDNYRFVSADGHAVTLDTHGRLTANTGEGVAELVRLGHGLGVAAQNVAAAGLADGRLTHVLPDWSLGEIETFAVWHANAPPAGLTRRLVEHLAQSLRM